MSIEIIHVLEIAVIPLLIYVVWYFRETINHIVKALFDTYWNKRKEGTNMAEDDIGDDSVVIGKVNRKVGNRSVVIGPTDDHGNTIIRGPLAAGYKARAEKNSIAIGAYANAGSDEKD